MKQCQNHALPNGGVTATTNAPAVTSLKKLRSHAALGKMKTKWSLIYRLYPHFAVLDL
ncbi:CIC_collapsed_G0024410.mRNA.1.CDS.1 [Saccharomyces cerevisiae]|nr:CIC_collapsed_G0024410.mRNA.1.CDS.1 [Saccharomyces cerevisiae]